MSKAVPLIWSNDDIQYGQTAQLQRQLDFCDRHGIPGVFFLIPQTGDKTLADDPQLLRVIEVSRSRGHAYYQHGHIHTPFESGVPMTWMLDFVPSVRAEYDARRLEIESQHTLEAMVAMIERGRTIWRAAFQEDSAGYRPGWGAICTNLYRALKLLNVSWVSSTIFTRTSWLWNQQQWDFPMQEGFDGEGRPYVLEGILEIPIAGDYGFRVPDEPARIDVMVDLALAEAKYCHERGWPFVICSHWHGLEHAHGSGYAVHEKLMPRLLQSGLVQPMGMAELFGWFGKDN